MYRQSKRAKTLVQLIDSFHKLETIQTRLTIIKNDLDQSEETIAKAIYDLGV